MLSVWWRVVGLCQKAANSQRLRLPGLGQVQDDALQVWIGVPSMRKNVGWMTSIASHHTNIETINSYGTKQVQAGCQISLSVRPVWAFLWVTPVLALANKTRSWNDIRLTLVGNSWQVGVIAWLVYQLCYKLGLCRSRSLQDIVDALTPGRGSHSGKLVSRLEGPLLRKLLGLVSIKGEDLMVQSASEPQVKFHRLRTSVPAKLWRWRGGSVQVSTKTSSRCALC